MSCSCRPQRLRYANSLNYAAFLEHERNSVIFRRLSRISRVLLCLPILRTPAAASMFLLCPSLCCSLRVGGYRCVSKMNEEKLVPTTGCPGYGSRVMLPWPESRVADSGSDEWEVDCVRVLGQLNAFNPFDNNLLTARTASRANVCLTLPASYTGERSPFLRTPGGMLPVESDSKEWSHRCQRLSRSAWCGSHQTRGGTGQQTPTRATAEPGNGATFS